MTSPFAPRLWGAHVVALLAVGAASGLGYWQYDAWHAHREAEAIDLTTVAPEPLGEVLGPDDPFPGDKVGQPVSVAGTWVPTGTVFVSGREHDGEDGYWVVTPLAIGDADAPALPIVRGWVADPALAPPAPSGEARLVAWLQPTEGTTVADDDRSDDVLPQVRTADLIQHVDQDLYGAFAVVATGEAADPDAVNDGTGALAPASLSQLPAVDRFTGLRNLLYALEWVFFGAFAAFIWWRYVREETQAPTGAQPEPSAARPGSTVDV